MPDDKPSKAEKRETLKASLLTEFNRVAPKVVKVTDLLQAFDDLAGNNLNWLERVYAKHKLNQQLKSGLRGEGVFEGADDQGKPAVYVDSTFLKTQMVAGIDRGDANGHEESARKVGVTAVQALERVPDQTAKVATGQIKPKTP
ncbi:MAG: hypothetical protein ACAH80_03340 [Alphaproteobacteria bacterium]